MLLGVPERSHPRGCVVIVALGSSGRQIQVGPRGKQLIVGRPTQKDTLTQPPGPSHGLLSGKPGPGLDCVASACRAPNVQGQPPWHHQPHRAAGLASGHWRLARMGQLQQLLMVQDQTQELRCNHGKQAKTPVRDPGAPSPAGLHPGAWKPASSAPPSLSSCFLSSTGREPRAFTLNYSPSRQCRLPVPLRAPVRPQLCRDHRPEAAPPCPVHSW